MPNAQQIKKEIKEFIDIDSNKISKEIKTGLRLLTVNYLEKLRKKESEVQEYKQIAEDKQTLVDQYEKEIEKLQKENAELKRFKIGASAIMEKCDFKTLEESSKRNKNVQI